MIPPKRTRVAEAAHRLDVARERATRVFLGDDPVTSRADGNLFDLADEAEDVLPQTARVRGLRAAEEA